MRLYTGLLFAASICLCVAQDSEIRNPPNILEPRKAETKYVGKTHNVELKCQAEGIPTPTYTWQKNGRDVVVTPGHIEMDAKAGTLKIIAFDNGGPSNGDEGEYRCVATSTWTAPDSRQTKAVALSPITTLLMIEIITGITTTKNLVKKEYEFLSIPCEGYSKAQAPGVTKSWYIGDSNQINVETSNGRIFQDDLGTLHFLYLKKDDSTDPLSFRCALSYKGSSVINLLNRNHLTVSVQDPVPSQPRLLYKTDPDSSPELKVELHSTGELQCVFEGYDPNSADFVPDTTWFKKGSNEEITGSDDKFGIDPKYKGRKLEIKRVEESDEGDWYCQGKNTQGVSEKIPVKLDVVSPPIFDKAGDQPVPITSPERTNVEFHCKARSTRDEDAPQPPVWYINGVQTGAHTDTNKIEISSDKKTLRVLSLSKATDIMCVQCEVTNAYGTSYGEGCLTVIKNIELSVEPPVAQDVVYGDLVDLHVEATTDPAFKDKLERTWQFIPAGEDTPQDLTNMEDKYIMEDPGNPFKLFINTSMIPNKEEYQSIAGKYILEVYHQYQKITYETVVRLVDPTPTEAPIVVQSAGFPMWIIAVIAAIIVLIIVIIIVVCIVNKKQQEGDYNVDKKEVGAGLDPKKELMEKGFDDYSRPNIHDYEDVPRAPLPYDEDVPLQGEDQKSLGDYSEDEEARMGFNEDGSFIGQYYKKDPKAQRPPSDNFDNQPNVV